MRRRVRVLLDADATECGDAAVRVLGVQPGDGGTLTGNLYQGEDRSATLAVRCDQRAPHETEVALEARSQIDVPYFGWFVRLLVWVTARSALRHAAARLRAELAGEPPPPAPKRPSLVPAVSFSSEQAAQLAAVAAVALLASFGGALLTQNGDAVTRAFDESDQALGFALALVRAGVLLSLVASALSDRLGRRRLLLGCLVALCLANAVSAAAPTFEVFTASQLVARGFVNATLVVAAVVAVEEAPDGARAFAFSMLALALGAGFGLSVLLLPLADLGDYGWRIAFGISALAVLCVPSVSRNLKETARYRRIATRTGRGSLREIFEPKYRARFLSLGIVAFLINAFSAPSSQLTNRYLSNAHDYSNSEVALFRGVTAGVPGFLGIVLAGRLAETRGRRPVTIVGLIIGSIFQMVFFLGDGALLWLTPMIAIVAAACAGLAVGTLDAELFPTETRGTSNGFLLVCGVAGSATGLLLATQLKDVVGGLGPAIALCGIAPLLAALLVVPRLPETKARTLDELSPSEL